jgi:hypothetical protein
MSTSMSGEADLRRRPKNACVPSCTWKSTRRHCHVGHDVEEETSGIFSTNPRNKKARHDYFDDRALDANNVPFKRVLDAYETLCKGTFPLDFMWDKTWFKRLAVVTIASKLRVNATGTPNQIWYRIEDFAIVARVKARLRCNHSSTEKEEFLATKQIIDTVTTEQRAYLVLLPHHSADRKDTLIGGAIYNGRATVIDLLLNLAITFKIETHVGKCLMKVKAGSLLMKLVSRGLRSDPAYCASLKVILGFYDRRVRVIESVLYPLGVLAPLIADTYLVGVEGIVTTADFMVMLHRTMAKPCLPESWQFVLNNVGKYKIDLKARFGYYDNTLLTSARFCHEGLCAILDHSVSNKIDFDAQTTQIHCHPGGTNYCATVIDYLLIQGTYVAADMKRYYADDNIVYRTPCDFEQWEEAVTKVLAHKKMDGEFVYDCLCRHASRIFGTLESRTLPCKFPVSAREMSDCATRLNYAMHACLARTTMEETNAYSRNVADTVQRANEVLLAFPDIASFEKNVKLLGPTGSKFHKDSLWAHIANT